MKGRGYTPPPQPLRITLRDIERERRRQRLAARQTRKPKALKR